VGRRRQASEQEAILNEETIRHTTAMDSDRRLTKRITEELAQQPGVEMARVVVEVHHGVVTLRGEVSSSAAACLAGRSAMRVRGANALINELSVRAT
jgi:osmotically-inducible protein OsmY